MTGACVKGGIVSMGRKKRCPKCGSKKIDVYSVPQRCKVCGYTWTGTGRKKAPKKDKVRF